MTGFVGNIEEVTLKNDFFRQVIFTGEHSQLVVMNLIAGEEIGAETHTENDQFLRIEKGRGKVIIGGEETMVSEGFAIVIPAGSEHNVINLSMSEPLKLYTIYSPPHHRDGTIHRTKAEAAGDSEDHV